MGDERDEAHVAMLESLVKSKAAELGEHFECVQIMVSRCEGDRTYSIEYGTGNVFARVGHAEHWIEKMSAHNHCGDDDEDEDT